MFLNIVDAVNWIEHQVKFKPKTDLERMHKAVTMLDHPESSYKIIHVAGTNGKGSVTSYISTILNKHYKIGTYTSPYILKFNERIKVSLEMIPDHELLKYINFMYDFNQTFETTTGENLSFFELITLIAFLYFRDQKVDIVVLEVGLGGLLDATNVVKPIASVITNIGYDHMAQLGNTLESIANNKLGIVKENIPLFTAVDEALLPQFKAYTSKMNSPLYWVANEDYQLESNDPIQFRYEYHQYTLSLKGLYQIKNAILAIQVVNYLFPKVPLHDVKDGLAHTDWPGRFEVFNLERLVVLDGAHNIHGIEALTDSLNKIYKDKKKHILFCAMADKETKRMLDCLSGIASSMTLTHFDYKRVKDLPLLLEETNHPNKKAINDPFEAIETVLKNALPDDLVVVTGSLYFVSLVRPYLITKK